MNKQLIIIGGAIVLILIVGAVVLTSRSKPASPQSSSIENNSVRKNSPNSQVIPNESQNPASGAATASVRKFAISGGNYKFSLAEIRVKQGEKVEVTFTNEEGFHDWKVDEFNVSTAVIGAGKSETVAFVANKTGTFEYYCSVDGHRQKGMKGNLIVE